MSLTEWKAGIDIGSTTVKMVLLDEENRIIYKRYERHMSDVFLAVKKLLEEFQTVCPDSCRICITGSGGLSLAEHLHLPFRQEVIACSEAVKQMIPQTDVAIELGGEDAKITFYDKTIEQRMNGTCAGGTGAFIDQMALLLNTDAAGLNEAAKEYRILYPIAARCGVFAKTDIQPLINEGARRADLAASIFQAVVPDLLDFIMYTQKCKEFCCEKLDLSRKACFLGKLALAGLYGARRAVDRALEKSRRFQPHVHIDHIAKLASQVTSLGTQCGEGWMLSGEMQELIENGVRNIVILQPFGCLPNHIVGKGVMKPLRKLHDDVNLAAIDYDPGASHVNQLNRIKLMMSVAHSNLKKEM